MAKCPHCGAEFAFEVKKQLVHCDYCGSDFDPRNLKNEEKVSKKEENALEGVVYNCTQCGASLMTFDETAVTFCNYCGSQNMIEDKITKQMAPDYIIPFAKSQEECIKNYKRKLFSFFFSPSYMKDDVIVKKFRGIYMPYGVYKLNFHGDAVNSGEKYNHRSGDYVYYDDYAIHADVDATYEGISFDLISKYYDHYSHAIPFNFKQAVPFNSSYLPGFYADSRDVEIDTYCGDAIQLAAEDSSRFLLKNKTFRKYSCHNPKVPFQIEDKKVALFPVYFLATKNPKNDTIHYAVINGQTGKVAADMPISFVKYIIVSIIIAIPIYVLLLGLPVILPSTIDIFAIVVTIISFILCNIETNACYDKDEHTNDKGFRAVHKDDTETITDNSKKKKNGKKIFRMKKENVLKYVGAIVIPLIPILTHMVSDVFYYIAAMISLLLVLWSFLDLVQLHNRLVSNPIPQLGKRGGDEHE